MPNLLRELLREESTFQDLLQHMKEQRLIDRSADLEAGEDPEYYELSARIVDAFINAVDPDLLKNTGITCA